MNEQRINRPLSGQEVKDAIIAKIRKVLEKDCFLAPHLAYGAFSMHYTLKIQFQRAPNSIESPVGDESGMIRGCDSRCDSAARNPSPIRYASPKLKEEHSQLEAVEVLRRIIEVHRGLSQNKICAQAGMKRLRVTKLLREYEGSLWKAQRDGQALRYFPAD